MAKQKEYRHEMAGGDVGKMRRLYREWTRAANERIRVTAPKAGAQAYKNIVAPLEGASYVKYDRRGNIIFKGLGRKPDEKTVREAFTALARFMESKTSTVAGIKDVAKKRAESLDKMVKAQGLGGAVSTGDKEAILRWLGSEEGRDAKRTFDSDLVIHALMLDVIARPQAGTVYERWEAFERRGETLSGWVRDNQDRLAGAAQMG